MSTTTQLQQPSVNGSFELSTCSNNARHKSATTWHDIQDEDRTIGEENVSTAPDTASHQLERWNAPRANTFRLVAAFFSMFIFGLNDAAFGALIPYLEPYYDLSYTVVSLVFLVQFSGYVVAAFTNAWFHSTFGQRGVAVVTATTRIVTYIVFSVHAPWPCIIVFTAVVGFGNGLADGAWSAWAGHMAAGNVLEGSLHAFYSLGATLSPLIATSLITQDKLPWYYFYYIMIGLSAAELCMTTTAFWAKDGARYRRDHPRDPNGGSRMKEAVRNKVTWLCSIFFLLYVGAEVALGGWIVTFMLDVRKASAYTSGLTATGFWGGMTLGRVGLGVVTHNLIEYTNTPSSKFSWLKLTERSIVLVYLLLSVAFQLLLWLVPSAAASIVSVTLLGMFLGPIFPSGIIMATKILPPHIHISSIGFSTALGGTGGAAFPFAVGAIAQAKGVQVLQPIVLAVLGVLVLIWLAFPRLPAKTRSE